MVRLRTCDVCRLSVEDDSNYGRTKLAPIDRVGVWGYNGSYGLADMCRDCFKAFEANAKKWVSDRQ